MWAPPNQHRIPSQEEVLQTKLSISELENEVVDAEAAEPQTQQRIAELKQDLALQRAWIAPIRRIPFEVLSEVFMICGRNERLAPLVIGEVCREWRKIVVGTPAVWVCVYPQNRANKILPLKYVELFLARSNPHKLHMRIRWASSDCHYWDDSHCDCPNVKLVFREPHRIQCLAAHPFWFKKFSTTIFPNLVRFTFDQVDAKLDAPLDMSRFPSLRYLKLSGNSGLNKAIDFSRVVQPQLQCLDLIVDGDGNWARLIAHCSRTLKALRVDVDLGEFGTDRKVFDCPELEHLSVRDALRWSTIRPPGFIVKAPILISYTYLANRDNPTAHHCGAKNILYLCINCDVALCNYPRLRVLQVKTLSNLWEAVSQLERDPSLCGNLERIEILCDVTSMQDHLAGIRQCLGDKNQRSRSNFIIHLQDEHIISEFSYYYTCSDSMPCNFI